MIIFDRKRKRKNNDEQWSDPLGVEEARKNKAVTIEIPKDSKNPAHIVMSNLGAKGLIGKVAYALNSKKEILCGIVVDVIPPGYLHLRNKGMIKIEEVISIGG